MLLSEDTVGVPLNLNLKPSSSHFVLLISLDQEAKKGVTMLTSLINLCFPEENEISVS